MKIPNITTIIDLTVLQNNFNVFFLYMSKLTVFTFMPDESHNIPADDEFSSAHCVSAGTLHTYQVVPKLKGIKCFSY